MIIQSAPPGPPSLFSMSAFGAPDQEFQRQLQHRNQVMQQNMMQNYGFDASHFFQQSQLFFQNYQNNTGMIQAETLILQGQVNTQNALVNNIFTPISSLGDFQSASEMQQTYLMCNPFLRGMYLEGKISGFEGAYHNHWGNAIGFDDPVFRQAVSGLSQSSYMQLPDDVDEIFVECLDDPIPDLPVMTAGQQNNWIQACKLGEVLVSEGIDVTHKNLKFIEE